MTAEAAAQTSEHPSEHRIRVALLIVAIIKIVGALSTLAILFDGDGRIPGPTPAGQLITATILLAAPVAIAAFVFALRGNIAFAIVAIALLVLLDWLSLLPSVAISWDGFPGSGYEGGLTVINVVVLPVLAIAAIILALRRTHLGLATLFAILPTILSALGVIAFGIGVAIYGF